MKPVFADTFYFIALLSSKDEAHVDAVWFLMEATAPMITTAWVLAELGDGLSKVERRHQVRPFIRSIRQDARVIVLPVRQADFDRGLDLYAARPDKEWSLTDCISFNTMRELNLDDALTGDRHFTQAGFNILFP